MATPVIQLSDGSAAVRLFGDLTDAGLDAARTACLVADTMARRPARMVERVIAFSVRRTAPVQGDLREPRAIEALKAPATSRHTRGMNWMSRSGSRLARLC